MPDRVLITGASSGIGEATALAFADKQSELFLVARRQERLARVADGCRTRGASRVITRSHDLSIPGEGKRIVEACLQELGGLDILISNAGYGMYGSVSQVTPEEMRRIWRVNYQSGYESIHAALPHLLGRQKGHIVLVSSVIGKKALPYSGTYCATKFAQVALGEALWSELRGTGVGVSVICPGRTATEFQESARVKEGLDSIRRLGGGQSPVAVARAIVQAVEKNRREVHLTLPGKLLVWMNRLAPGFTTWAIAWGIQRSRKNH